MEEWRDIEGYKGLYQVSNLGLVKSIFRYKKILKCIMDRCGYYCVFLCLQGKARKFLVHRLVASAFIPNDENKPCVNHMDGDRSNNHLYNLEWCTYSENVKHSFHVLGRNPSRGGLGKCGSMRYNSKNIIQISIGGNVINEFESRGDASRATGVSSGNIWLAMNGRRNHAGGYRWMYKNSIDKII